MDDENKFVEQEAPLKNTDDAFVEVGSDGAPLVPNDPDKKTDIERENHPTTLDKR